MSSLCDALPTLAAWRVDPLLQDSTHYCVSRDQFTARLSRITTLVHHADAALIAAVLGELGNNCFDHNLGQWLGRSGCWFEHGCDSTCVWAIVADQGQGIRGSLRHMLPPDIHTDQAALEFAFEKQISGRSPEQRGNGLKFVRGVINGAHPRGLLCHSGTGIVHFGLQQSAVKTAYAARINTTEPILGTTTIVQWTLST